MRPLATMLGKAIGREEVLRAARAQAALRQWPRVVGAELARRSRPDRYDRGTVWVAVEGSAWAQELRMIRDVILDRLERECGEGGLFHDIRFGVRPLPPEEASDSTRPNQAVVADDREGMSIREIAERRLRAWRDSEPD